MDSSLNFNKLYAVTLKISEVQFKAKPQNHADIPFEEMCGYTKGMFPKGKPDVFIQYAGNEKRKPDLIVPGVLGLVLYHKDLITLLTEKGFTGWDSYPVKILCKNGEINEEYHVFVVKD